MQLHVRRLFGPPAYAGLFLACSAGAGTGAARDMGGITPIRAQQAPLVTVRQVVESDSLVGRRVRIAGACVLAGTGPSTGVWVLQSDGFTIEVRGLVPRTCFSRSEDTETLTIFAQVEPKAPETEERLLLRLPD
jgi:hypothetical protein